MSFQYASWPLPAGVYAGWSTRQSGVSTGAFGGHNVARHVGEPLATVEHNRAILRERLQGRPNIHWLNQTHSTVVVNAQDADPAQGQDASVTREDGEACCVMTADCLPVFFWQHDGRQVAVAHAGWRGLADGILLNTLTEFEDPARVSCGVGPAILQPAFEVGQDVVAAFSHWPESARFFSPGQKPGKFQCDLPGLARAQLQAAGVHRVYLSNLCSFSQQQLFYSYRRDGQTGRMANLIWMSR